MNSIKNLSLLAVAISSVLLTGCGDAETTINELPPIEDHDDHDHDDDHDGEDHDHDAESSGRLMIADADSNAMAVFDLEDNSLLDTFSVTHSGSALTHSADYRFAVVSSRTNDLVEFIDGGVWREDHVDHMHDYEEAPALSDFSLVGSQPTHVVSHDGQLAVFFDGNADTSMPASVQVVSDNDIATEANDIPTLTYSVNMHGVAKPVDDMLIATVRRDDAESVSANPVLPDSVGIYHWHDGEYEQEQLFAGECPDLHGAALNEEFVVLGCSDGVLVLHAHDEEYESQKVSNIDELNGMRVGSVYAHHDVDTFIGVASQHGGGSAVITAIDPDHGEMEVINWEPETDAHPVSYGFSYDGEYFLILDDKGHLTVLSAEAHDDHEHWELTSRIHFSEEDLNSMPDNAGFSMSVAQNAPLVYITDPIAQHVLIIDLEHGETEGDIELDFVPSAITWLGIAEAH
ncbi:MAG: 5-methyltetrahydrofolate--homocysteine methyltransferase [Alteromonadaceae bacterium]|nr:5-methyltetrahydrofolate--homocysteine methyltransferase [Alteromonadaceae bacterium]